MLEVTITGVAPFDGVYTLDPDRSFNGRELHLIKQVAGVRLGELQDALFAGDYDLIIALATITLIREGRVEKTLAARTAELLLDADTGSIVLNDAKADDSPPVGPPIGGEHNATSTISSPGSSGISDGPPATTPTSTGTGGLAAAASPSLTSVT